MNQQVIRKAGRIAGNALQAAVLLGIVAITEISAQSSMYANHFTTTEATEINKPKSLQVAVYQVENTTKFKVHFENEAHSPVTLQIKNAAGKVLHQEVVNDKKYVRKFDLEKMEDGDYIFEISNKQENYTKEIQLQTLSARTVQVNE